MDRHLDAITDCTIDPRRVEPRRVGKEADSQTSTNCVHVARTRLHCYLHMHIPITSRGVVVNFDLGEWFPRSRSQQRGRLHPRARRVAVLGVSAGGGRPLPLRESGGVIPRIFFEIFDAKSRVWGQFGPENKLIEGQPNEYDGICRNASVLAFHLWPTIFAGAPFWLQNICQNGVPLRSRTTTPLITRYTTPPLPAHAHSNYKAMIIMIVKHVS